MSFKCALIPIVFALLFSLVTELTIFVTKTEPCHLYHEAKKLNPSLKLILYATTFFGDVATSTSGYLKEHLALKCPNSSCMALSSQYRESCLNVAHAVIFSPVFRDFFGAMPLFARRKRRRLDQFWIIKMWETPPTLRHMLLGGLRFFEWADGRFNLTLSYRKDADIPTPYRAGFKLLENPAPRPFPTEIFQKKKRHVAAVISNCNDAWRSLERLKELENYGVTVDIYGACGSRSCPGRVSESCFRQLETEYFFYAGLENSICKDYFTEKFHFPLQYDMVMLAAGGADYDALAPPHSYIRWGDFRTPKELAEKLLAVSSNETAYREYFEWKGRYMFPNEPPYIFGCKLCEILHNNAEKQTKMLTNLKEWYVDKSECRDTPYLP